MLLSRQPVSASSTPSPLLGKIAPPLKGSELRGGYFDLAHYRGSIVVVNFWSSWCVACVREAPDLSSFAWEQRQNGVILVGVVFNDTLESATAFEHHYGSLYNSVIDTSGKIANSYGVSAPPTTFIIDRKMQVVASLLGPVSDRQLTRIVALIH
jgi:cytochrome c biogenesis protein CcmG/thiol:disulfide interchange protein DsbE